MGAREQDFGSAVEHFFNFGDFCSTLGGARGGFGVGGRTFFQFWGFLFYFWEVREADFESAVEHFFNFGRFCSTFGGARAGSGLVSRQNSVEKPIFLSTLAAAGTGFDRRDAFRLQINCCSERGTAINKKARQTSDSLKIIF